jgi:acyl carrier protein
MRRKVEEIIHESIKSISAHRLSSKEIKTEIRLSGHGAPFDSMGLITLLVEIEYRVQREFGREVLLLNENAFSNGVDPFRSVNTLIEHITGLLNS